MADEGGRVQRPSEETGTLVLIPGQRNVEEIVRALTEWRTGSLLSSRKKRKDKPWPLSCTRNFAWSWKGAYSKPIISWARILTNLQHSKEASAVVTNVFRVWFRV